MNKFFYIILLVFVFTGCSYEPILTNKQYDFGFENIKYEGEEKINKIIKKELIKISEGDSNYDLTLKSLKTKNIVGLDKKGDPSIFNLKINLKYEIIEQGKIILSNNLEKQISYNNMDDKFELSNKENEIIIYLSESFVDEILRSTIAIDR